MHNTVNNLFRLAQGKFIPSVFFEKIRQPYMNQMRKYLMKRITTPFWPYGGKAWLNPVTKDVYYNADVIDPRIKTKGVAVDEVLLDNAHKKMSAKIEAPKEQIDFLNTIFQIISSCMVIKKSILQEYTHTISMDNQ